MRWEAHSMDHTVDTPASETITTGPPRYTTIRDSAASGQVPCSGV